MKSKWRDVINKKETMINLETKYNEQLRGCERGMPQMILKDKDASNKIKMKRCHKWNKKW